jgi:hypothetical protein
MLARIQPAPYWHTSIDGAALISEPHHLLLVIGDWAARLTDCRCEDCLDAAPGLLDLERIDATSLAALLAENEIGALAIAPHGDLLLPGSDGEPSRSLATVFELAAGLRALGVSCDVVRLPSVAPGAWVCTTGFAFIAPDHVVVPGLLGQVVPDDYGICTPGISTYIQLLGRKEPYGYPDDLVEVLDEAPAEEDEAASRRRCRRALHAYEEVHGWTGYLDLGAGRPRSAAEAAAELERLVGSLADADSSLREADRRGRWKRARRIILAFAEGAGSSDARGFIERHGMSRELTPAVLVEARALARRLEVDLPCPDVSGRHAGH